MPDLPSASHTTDFNKQFADLSAKITKGSVKEVAPIISIMNAGSSHKSSVTVQGDAVTNHHLHNGLSHSMNRMGKKLDEVLARFAVFERQFFNGQTVNVKEENNFPDPKEIEQHEAFMTSNRLPIKNVNDLNRFEQNLKNSEFLNATVSVNTFG